MYCSFEEKKLRHILKSRLSHARYTHSKNVAVRAEELAQRYGCDAEKAYFAGLMHDVCKDDPKRDQLSLIENSGIVLDDVTRSSPQLLHAIAGRCWLVSELNIQDDDILNAVRYHTTGRAEMSLLEEIIYLADLTSSERDYEDAIYTRDLVDESPEKGLLHSLSYTITYLARMQRLVCPDTIWAYNYYVAKTLEGVKA